MTTREFVARNLKTLGIATLSAATITTMITGCRTPGLLGSPQVPPPYLKPAPKPEPRPATTSMAPKMDKPNRIDMTPINPEPAKTYDPIVPEKVEPPVAIIKPKPTVMPPKVQTPPADFPPPVTSTPPPLPEPKVEPITYTVKKGDSLWKIGRMYGVSMQEIANFNGIGLDKVLHPGDVIKLPPGAAFVPPEKRPKITKPEPTSTAKRIERRPRPSGTASSTPASRPTAKLPIPADGKYTVQKGDSISKIAHTYGLTTKELKDLNNLNSDLIYPGNTLLLKRSGGSITAMPEPTGTITPAPLLDVTPLPDTTTDPVPAPASAAVDFSSLTKLPYFCTSDDTLESIAQFWNSKVEWILKANPQVKSDADLKQGMKIDVPVLPEE